MASRNLCSIQYKLDPTPEPSDEDIESSDEEEDGFGSKKKEEEDEDPAASNDDDEDDDDDDNDDGEVVMEIMIIMNDHDYHKIIFLKKLCWNQEQESLDNHKKDL